jgi:hypothetical protein
MDGSQFDHLIRDVARSRRSALKILLGAAVAAPAFGRRSGAAATPWAFSRVNQTCKNGEPCGALAPCTGGVCRPILCKIDGELYQPGAHEDGDWCRVCDPANGPLGWQQWSPAPDGTACGIGSQEDDCEVVTLVCMAGACVTPPQLGESLDVDWPCTDDGDCCHGVCCRGFCCPEGEICGVGGCMRHL